MMQMMTRTPLLMHPLKILTAVGAAFLLWGLVLAYASSPAWAANITVDSTDDTVADDGQCTLREAITAANTDTQVDACATGSGADTIDLPSGTYTLSSQLEVTSAVTVDGGSANPTISGNDQVRVFLTGGGAKLTLSNLTVANGYSGDGAYGGGIYNNGGTLDVSNSAFSNNSAYLGGGILNNYGTLTVTNSTFSGNRASQAGGGIYNSSTLRVTNSTFSNNRANQGGGILSTLGQAKLSNTIVANSTSGGNCRGIITDAGGNLADDSSCNFTNASSKNNTAAGLDPDGLKDNGGPTQTIALLPGSAAIDAALGGDTCPATDQRGVSRPQGAGCDIGAFELGTITVNSDQDNDMANSDLCTLREAINNANSDTDTTNGDCASGSGPDTIIFNLGSSATINPGSTLPDITDADGLTIDGGRNQITINGNHQVRVFYVGRGAKSTLARLTVADGSADQGAGISNYGTLTVTNSTFSGNRATNGFGGAIVNPGAIDNDGTLTVTNSTFSGNSARSGGGAIANDGSMEVTNSTFSGNSASDTATCDGVICNINYGTIKNTIFANNSGGNCANYNQPPFTLTDGGYNIDTDGTCVDETVTTSQTTDDPGLDPKGLQDNGGPTQTIALMPGSPAIDAAVDANCPSTDQRGVARPQDGDGDGTPRCDIGAFELDNSAPSAVNDAYTTDEDTKLTVNALDGVLKNDTDADTGDTLKTVLVSGPSNAASFALNADGSFSYTPKADYNGPDSFTYKANDGTVDSGTVATVNITVNPANDAPVASNGTASMKEDAAPIQIDFGALVSDLETSDADLAYTIVNAPSAQQGTLSGSGSTRTFTPAENFNGTVTIDYKVTDRGDPDNCTGAPGASCDAPKDSATKSVTITVTPVNDAPTVAVAAGGQCGTSGSSGQINLMVADVESAPGSLTLSATSSDTKIVPNSGLLVGGSGASRTLTVSASAKKSGTATITVRVSDGQASGTVPVTVQLGSDSGDTLGGTSGADIIFGKNGNDNITGGDGNDLLCGGNGAGTMSGGSGDDTLDGANGNDVLRGNAGKDILRGGAGDDRLTGGTEADSFDGGSGTDTATDFNATERDTSTNIP